MFLRYPKISIIVFIKSIFIYHCILPSKKIEVIRFPGKNKLTRLIKYELSSFSTNEFLK